MLLYERAPYRWRLRGNGKGGAGKA